MDRHETPVSLVELRLANLELRMSRIEERLGAEPDAAVAPWPAAPAVPAPPPAPVWVAPAPAPAAPAAPAADRPLWTPTQHVRAAIVPERIVGDAASAPLEPIRPVLLPPEPEIAPAPALTLKDFEERFAGRALAWIGGIALVAAAVFFLSLAFSRGWITEPMRVLIGLVGGGVAFGAGAVLLDRRNALIGNVLTGVGVGVVEIALFAATRLYNLLPAEAGLAGALVVAVVAAATAIRFDARPVAVYGLVAALIAPPVMGAGATLLTLLFMAVILGGTTAIALFRTWVWLPPLGFVLAAPQLASWLVGEADPVQAVIALAGFWLVNTVAAAGEEARIRRDDLRPSSASLVLASGTFLLWGIFETLGGPFAGLRGFAIGLASIAHLLVASWFLARQGLQHLFGTLVGGAGIALLALASFVQLGAPAVPVAWAAEAVALAWLAVRRHHAWSALAAVVLGSLAVLHVVVVEYPLEAVGLAATPYFGTPLLHPAGGSLLAVIAALVVAIAIIPSRTVRSVLAGIAVVIAAYGATFEVAGPALAGTLVALALAGLLADRGIAHLAVDDTILPAARAGAAHWAASLAALVPTAFALMALVTVEVPGGQWIDPARTPFLVPGCLSVAIVLAGLVAAWPLLPARLLRGLLAATGIAVLAWTVPTQVVEQSRIALLVLLLPAGVLLDRVVALRPSRADLATAGLGAAIPVASVAGALAWVLALLTALAWSLNPFEHHDLPAVPFTDQAALAGALLVGSLLAAARWLQVSDGRRAAVIAALLVSAEVATRELGIAWFATAWLGLGVIAAKLHRMRGAAERPYRITEVVLVGLAALAALVVVAAPHNLWIDPYVTTGGERLVAWWWVPFAAFTVAWADKARSAEQGRPRTTLEALAVGTFVYAVSVAVVDVFHRGVGGAIATEELAKQAQVALSVWWTASGAGLLVVGLAKARPNARHGGFGLLGLATAKVVLVDMASMDVAYRALVLFGLGLLLLASAWAVGRFRGPGTHSGRHGVRGHSAI